MTERLHFGLEDMPEYEGPNPDRVMAPDADCCTRDECGPRDYARAMLLTLERLAQTYAGLRLLAWNTARMWPCEEPEGHTEDCPNEQCRFGSEIQAIMDTVIERYAMVTKEVFAALVIPAMDLHAQWQDFFDAEQAHVGLLAVAQAVKEHKIGPTQAWGMSQVYVDMWKRLVVGDDDVEYARWFLPPEPADPIPFKPRGT